MTPDDPRDPLAPLRHDDGGNAVDRSGHVGRRHGAAARCGSAVAACTPRVLPWQSPALRSPAL
jgi:hypothetical protein